MTSDQVFAFISVRSTDMSAINTSGRIVLGKLRALELSGVLGRLVCALA